MIEHCSICGYIMKKDPFNGRPFCSLRGNDFAITNESVEGTFEEAQAQIKSMKTPSNKRSSVFAKMDEKEEYNAERTRMLQEAANPPEEYPNFGDFLNKPPKVNYGNSWEEPAGTLTGNIVLDIVDFLISEPYDGYNPEMLSHVRRYRAQSHAPKMSDLPKSLEKNVDANKSMTPDDMMNCQRELKTLIRDEERSILNYRRHDKKLNREM